METRQGTIQSISTGRVVSSGQLTLRRSQPTDEQPRCHVVVGKEKFNSTNLQDRFEVKLEDGRRAEVFFSRVEDDNFVFRCVDDL